MGEAVWLASAFSELNTTRRFHMGGIGPIPLNMIWEWQDRFGAPIWFADAIMQIDGSFLKQQAEEQKSDGKRDTD